MITSIIVLIIGFVLVVYAVYLGYCWFVNYTTGYIVPPLHVSVLEVLKIIIVEILAVTCIFLFIMHKIPKDSDIIKSIRQQRRITTECTTILQEDKCEKL